MTFRKNLIDTLFLIPFSFVFGSSFAFVTMQYRMLRSKLKTGEPVLLGDYIKVGSEGGILRTLARNQRNYP